MSIPPGSIEAGKCYLVRTGRADQPQGVHRVIRIVPDGRVQFAHRTGPARTSGWTVGMQDARSFAYMAVCEVPCTWAPEADA